MIAPDDAERQKAERAGGMPAAHPGAPAVPPRCPCQSSAVTRIHNTVKGAKSLSRTADVNHNDMGFTRRGCPKGQREATISTNPQRACEEDVPKMIKETVVAVSIVTMAAGAALAPSAVSADDGRIVVADSHDPCNPCAADPCNPCAACNPCCADPCNPCAC